MKKFKFNLMALCLMFIFSGVFMSCNNNTFPDGESSPSTEMTDEKNDDKDKYNGKVVLDDRIIIENNVEIFQDSEELRLYATLPVLELLKNLDCEIIWLDSHQVKIISNKKEYLFELNEQVLTKENGDYIMINAIGGGKNYFRVEKDELYLNLSAVIGLLREIEKPCYINIDQKTNTVIVTKRY